MATTIVTKKGSGAPAASDLVEGELAVDTTNGRLYTENSSAAVVELGSNPSGNITFGDNGKAIFGAGSDLQIYHDGSNSYIVDNGTGDLLIRAENNLFLKRTNSDETYLSGAVNGAVTLFHNNNAKIATTISGIDVTGSVTADGLTVNPTTSAEISGAVSGGYILKLDNTHASSGNGLRIETPSTAANEYSLVVKSNNGSNNNLVVSNNGDLSLYEDTGTTAKFFWDASAESLGIGTNPNTKLHVSSATTTKSVVETTGAASDALIEFTKGQGSGNTWSMGLDHSNSSAFSLAYLSNGSPSLTTHSLVTVDTSGNLLVGQSTASSNTVGTSLRPDGRNFYCADGNYSGHFNRKSSDGAIVHFAKDDTIVGSIGTFAGDLTIGDDDVGIRFDTGTGLIPWDLGANSTGGAATDGAIDIGAASARFKDLYLSGNAYVGNAVTSSTDGSSDLKLEGNQHIFRRGSAGSYAEQARLDASGNFLVGKSSTSGGIAGSVLASSGLTRLTASGIAVAEINRLSSDGSIVDFKKDGTTVGSISSTATGGGSIIIGNDSSGIMFRGDLTGSAFIPANPATGAQVDNGLDIGHSVIRFDDIYATNGTIQTSDRNEKQDIAELSDAEQRVAVVAKGLLRKFRWKSSVAEKGDEARTHFGIIAQDLQAAFAAEGLDAGDYAMFINSTWTDEETGEERSRMGVRYSELLAFIIAAL